MRFSIASLCFFASAIGACEGPTANFCSIAANCADIANLNVTGTTIFEGPVIINFTGTAGDECGGGALSVPVI